jgi:hypothetical protein
MSVGEEGLRERFHDPDNPGKNNTGGRDMFFYDEMLTSVVHKLPLVK